MTRVARTLWVQVVAAAALGAVVGLVRPSVGVALQPLGDAFIRLVRMIIAPIIFTTVVTAIARVGGQRKLGRVAWKAIVAFEALTTVALLAGVAAALLLAPGAGMHVDPARIDTRAIAGYTTAGKALTVSEFLLGLIPRDVVDAFARDDVLQVVFFSVLFGVALALLREQGRAVMEFVEDLSTLLFRVMAISMRAAPLGAFGAVAFTVGQFGPGTLLALGRLVGAFYLACALFVLVVLGAVLRWTGLGLLPFLRYLRQELLITLGTSSSESALPLLMEKVSRLGCSRQVVGFVTPLGYSFNLAGTAIYLTLATAFIAQATGTHVGVGKGLEILAVLLVTSKTAVGITGSGFVVLAATLSAVGHVPVAGLTLLLGVDRLMSEARALTNLVSNGVAAVAVARWDGELDLARARAVLADVRAVEAEEYDAARIERPAPVRRAPAR